MNLVRVLAPVVEEHLTAQHAVSLGLTVGDNNTDLIGDGHDLAIRATHAIGSGQIAAFGFKVLNRCVDGRIGIDLPPSHYQRSR